MERRREQWFGRYRVVVTPFVSGAAQTPVVLGSATTTGAVDGLVNGTAYTFTVAATNANGTGPASAATPAITIGAPLAPTAVSGAPGNGQVTLSWTAPADNGSAISSYVATPFVNAVAQTPVVLGSPATTGVVTGLTNRTAYTFTVAATNANGTGPASTATTAITVGAPLAPTAVSGAPGNGQVTLSWTAPANNGSAINAYVITTSWGGYTRPAKIFLGGAVAATVTGLTNGYDYTFTVAAANANGIGPASAATTAITVGAPLAPTAVSAVAGNGQVTLSWTAPADNGSAINAYVVTPSVSGVAQTPVVLGSTTTTVAVDGLVNGTAYTFTVAATNANGTGPASAATTAVTVGAPLAPTAVSAVAGNGQVTLSWTAPADNGSAISAYVVTPFVKAVAQTPVVLSSTATTGVVPGLVNGTAYTLTVAATNANGTGPASAATTAITVGAPLAPTAVSAVAGNGQASLTWTAPTNNGSTINSYVITPFVGTTKLPAKIFLAGTTQTFTGLTNGTTYTFTVTAANANGTGPASTPTAAITVGVPLAPTAVSVVAGDGQASLTWTAPASNGSAISAYVITPFVSGVAQPPVVLGSPATTGVVPGLVNGTAYTFTVAATNANGTGPASTPTGAVTVGAPLAPTGVSVVAGNGQASLTWTAPTSNGSAISAYVVTPFVKAVAQAPVVLSSPATTGVVPGLVNGTAYTFTVAATNANGTSPASTPTTAITVGAPLAPTAVSAVPGNGQVTLSWTAPANNGSTINSYVITPFVGSTKLAAKIFLAGTTQTFTGLTNGTTYTFTIAAANANGIGPASAATAAITVGVPLAPTAVSVLAGNGQASLTWTAPTNNGSTISSYVITPSVSGVAQPPVVLSSTTTTGVVTGLTNGTVYTFTVAAANANGTGPASAATAVVTVGVPLAPIAVSGAPGNGQVTLSWTAPADNGSAISSYVVTPFVKAVAQPPVMLSSSATTGVVPGLVNGTAYTFTVAATNANGTGPASPATGAVTIGVPLAPTAVSVVAGNGQVTLSWTAPANNGSTINSYVITPLVGTTKLAAKIFLAGTTQTFTGLTNGTTYTFTVAAANANGIGVVSQPTAAVTAGVPLAPTGVSVVAGDGQAILTWTAPASNGSTISSYVITPFVSGVAQTPVVLGSTTTTGVVVGGLVNGTAYTFTVAATNANGTGPASAATAAVTVGAPLAPTAVSGSPGNGQVTLSWTAPADNGSAISSYVITPFVSGVAQPPVVLGSTTTTGVVVDGLVNGTAYTFTVAATNANGTGPASAATAAITVGAPLAPTAVSGAPGNGQVTLSWTAPANNGSTINSYVITPFVGTTKLAAKIFLAGTTQTFTGLTNGTTYTFTVAAANANGIGPASAATAAITVGVPAPPTGVSAVPGDGQASLTWTAPTNNGSTISAYVITPFVSGVAQPPVVLSSPATTGVVTGLTNGTAYAFTVAATNANGTGPASAATAAITIGAPLAPTAVSGAPGNGQVTLSWTAPADNGSGISSYVITPFVKAVAQPPVVLSSTATTGVVPGLVNGTAYTFTVAATNANGTGPASAATAAITVGAPLAPTAVSGAPGNGQVTLSWTAPANNGSTINSYVITPFVGTTKLAAKIFLAGTTQTFTGLTNGTTYTFTIAAANANGIGPASAATAAITVGGAGRRPSEPHVDRTHEQWFDDQRVRDHTVRVGGAAASGVVVAGNDRRRHRTDQWHCLRVHGRSNERERNRSGIDPDRGGDDRSRLIKQPAIGRVLADLDLGSQRPTSVC